MPVLRWALLVLLAAGPLLADQSAEAREHYKKGITHYALGEFEDAVKEFKESYRLKQEPAILFNIGQAYRQLHQWAEARFNFRQYLSLKPGATNRAEVESLIEQVGRRADEEKEQQTRIARDPAAARNTEAVLTPAPQAPAAAVSEPAAPPSRRPLHIAGYAALAAGVLGEGAALLFHGSAQSAADSFNQKYAAGTLTAADAHLRDDAQSKGKLATAAAIGGAALLVSGAVLSFAF